MVPDEHSIRNFSNSEGLRKTQRVFSNGRTGMTQSSELDLEAALRDPQAFFAEPKDIAAHPQLSRQSKLALLREWEQYARRLSVAEAKAWSAVRGICLGESSRLFRELKCRPTPADNFRLGPADLPCFFGPVSA